MNQTINMNSALCKYSGLTPLRTDPFTFRKDPAMHAEQFKILNVSTNEELASFGS